MDPLGQRGPRDVLDRLHQRDQIIVMVRANGRESDSTVSEDDGGHPMPTRWSQMRVPSNLTVIMGMDIHKSRRHRKTGGIDLRTGFSLDLTNSLNHAVADRHIACPGWGSAAID